MDTESISQEMTAPAPMHPDLFVYCLFCQTQKAAGIASILEKRGIMRAFSPQIIKRQRVRGENLVCLGVLCGLKAKEEVAKILLITLCISGFVVSGFEHCIANMGVFVVSACVVDGVSIAAMLKSMLIVTLGNMVGGAVLLAWPIRKMSADK